MLKYLAILLLSISSWAQQVNGPVPESYLTLRRTAVQVETEHGWGSGAIVKSPNTGNSYMLTNWHVCNGSNYPKHAKFYFGSGEGEMGTVVHMNYKVDLCIVRVEDQRRPAIIISRESPVPGTHLVTRGYPRMNLRESEGRYVEERTSLLDMTEVLNGDPCPPGNPARYNVLNQLVECLVTYPFGLTTLYSAPGSSGSAIVNDDSELVGVMQSSAADVNAGGIIPLRNVLKFFKGF